MNPSDLTPEKLKTLLQLAGQRLGATPDQLEAVLKTSRTEPLADRLSPALMQKLNALLGDREQVERLLASPEIKSYLNHTP